MSRYRLIFLAIAVMAFAWAACSDDDPVCPVPPDADNHAPVVETFNDTTIVLGDTLHARIVAHDPDGDVLNYKLTVLLADPSESGMTIDAGIDSVTGEFRFVPGVYDRPERSFLVTVIDEEGYGVSTIFKVAVTYYMDQVNVPYPALSRNILSYAPMGQEFVPGFSAIDIVELYLYAASPAGEFVVRIHSGTITGPVLGVSDMLALAAPFHRAATFTFDRINVTPGELLVMEIVQTSGTNWLIGSGGGPYSTYPLGRQIISGQPIAIDDLWFREGARSPRPPEAANHQSIAIRGQGEW